MTKEYELNKHLITDYQQTIQEFLTYVDNMEGRAMSTPWFTRKFQLAEHRKQTNSYDCGVYVCIFIYYLAKDQNFNFTERDMLRFRQYISDAITDNVLE